MIKNYCISDECMLASEKAWVVNDISKFRTSNDAQDDNPAHRQFSNGCSNRRSTIN